MARFQVMWVQSQLLSAFMKKTIQIEEMYKPTTM